MYSHAPDVVIDHPTSREGAFQRGYISGGSHASLLSCPPLVRSLARSCPVSPPPPNFRLHAASGWRVERARQRPSHFRLARTAPGCHRDPRSGYTLGHTPDNMADHLSTPLVLRVDHLARGFRGVCSWGNAGEEIPWARCAVCPA